MEEFGNIFILISFKIEELSENFGNLNKKEEKEERCDDEANRETMNSRELDITVELKDLGKIQIT